MIIIVSGLPGSGKSFFAGRLAQSLRAEYISSDLTRKALNARGRYTFSDKLAIYLSMADTVRRLVSAGKTVVVDATFSHHSMRDLFRQIARDRQVPLYFILIETSETLAKKRLSEPRQDSEADYEVYLNMKEQFAPYDFPHLILRSSEDNIEEMIQTATAYIATAHG